MSATPGRPAWVDDELFPYESRYVDIEGARIHYIDEGSGPTLLMLHGNPTWSFLYRDLVATLRDRFRCIALDLPGFGLSSAPTGYGFTAAEHCDVVERFVAELDLDGWTPVVQDWGGPIGLGAAGRAPERVAGLAILNTWAWPLQGSRDVERFSKLMGGPIGQFAILRLNAFVNVVMRWASRSRMDKRVLDQYRAPFPDVGSRRAVAVFPRQLLAAEPFLAEVEAGLEGLSDRPTLLCFSDRDPVFGERERERFARALPNHHRVTIEGAGHYLQEDAPGEIAEAIAAWHPAAAGGQSASPAPPAG